MNDKPIKIKINKKFFEMIKNKIRIFDILIEKDFDYLSLNSKIIYKNSTNTCEVVVEGKNYFNSLEEILNNINTKNLIGKSNIKSIEWYEKNYPDFKNQRLILIKFKII